MHCAIGLYSTSAGMIFKINGGEKKPFVGNFEAKWQDNIAWNNACTKSMTKVVD